MITADNAFARVAIMSGVWIVRAADPLAYQLGVTFTKFEITFQPDQGTIFVAERAAVIRDTCSRLFPKAKLEPATFDQWIQQEAGERP